LSKYRDRLQIIASILSIAGRRAKKTQIMYQANLSYRLLCRYLGEVLDAGLVSFENEDCYVLTAKGKEFLSRLRNILSVARTWESILITLTVRRRFWKECVLMQAGLATI
jgi:predicted transcriptional regulator